MDTHVTLTELAVRSQTAGATAFSALPDAPVLPVTSRRRGLGLASLKRALSGRRHANVAPRPAPGRQRPAAPRLPAAGPLCG